MHNNACKGQLVTGHRRITQVMEVEASPIHNLILWNNIRDYHTAWTEKLLQSKPSGFDLEGKTTLGSIFY